MYETKLSYYREEKKKEKKKTEGIYFETATHQTKPKHNHDHQRESLLLNLPNKKEKKKYYELILCMS